MKKIRVVCAVIQDGKRLLAFRRGSQSAHAGLWEFPGGKVKLGETLDEALHREIWEELMIKIKISKQLPLVEHQYDTFRIHLFPFLCSLEKGVIHLTEHDAYQWVDLQEAQMLDWSAADVAIWKAYFKSTF